MAYWTETLATIANGEVNGQLVFLMPESMENSWQEIAKKLSKPRLIKHWMIKDLYISVDGQTKPKILVCVKNQMRIDMEYLQSQILLTYMGKTRGIGSGAKHQERHRTMNDRLFTVTGQIKRREMEGEQLHTCVKLLLKQVEEQKDRTQSETKQLTDRVSELINELIRGKLTKLQPKETNNEQIPF